MGGEQDNSWQGCPGSRLKIKTGIVPHGGDAELLDVLWGNKKNIWHNKGLREKELDAWMQLSTCIWGLFIRLDIAVLVAPVVSVAVLFGSQ